MNENVFYAESSCVAARLSDPNINLEVSADDFSDQGLRLVWQAMDEVGCEIADLSEYLGKQTGDNWIPKLIEICDKGVTANAKRWAEKVRDYAERRRAMQIAKTLIQDLSKGGGQETINQAVSALGAIRGPVAARVVTLASATQEALTSIREGNRGLPSGIPKIDRNTGGFHPGDLVILGARTGVGKTAFMMQVAMHIASQGYPVGVMSGEQCAEQIAIRALAHTGVATVSDIRKGHVNSSTLDAVQDMLNEVPFWIDDTSAPSLMTVEKTARALRADHGIRVLFVDYLQRMTGNPKLQLHERIGECAKGLKTLATELGIPVICLAQLNRSGDNSPTITNLKDSGQIEQEADQIYLLHCDDPDFNAERYEVRLNLEKNRHGPVMSFRLMWERARMKYTEVM